MPSSIILLPCNNHLAMEQFHSTVCDGLSFDCISSLLNSEDLERLSEKGPTLHVWGLSESNYKASLFWNFLKIGDHAVFYTKNRLIFHARICHKCKNSQLSKAIWGENPTGGNWELLLFFDSCEHLDVIADEDILDESPLHSTPLLFKSNDEVVNHILELIGAEDKDGNIMIPKRREKQINDYLDSKLDSLKGHIDVDDITRDLLSEMNPEEPMAQRIRLRRVNAMCMARSRKIARFVKERANYQCEICGQPGFLQTNGELYAEAHHWDEVARFQTDDPGRMCCVCPTCHRVIHFGTDTELNARRRLNQNDSASNP